MSHTAQSKIPILYNFSPVRIIFFFPSEMLLTWICRLSFPNH